MLFNYILIVKWFYSFLMFVIFCLLLNEIFWIQVSLLKYSICFKGAAAEVVIASLEHLRFCSSERILGGFRNEAQLNVPQDKCIFFIV